MTDSTNAAKRAAARAAADLVQTGTRVGFGTGSTFVFVLERLAERIREEGLDVAGVPTSEATAARARDLGVSLIDLDAVEELDLAIDGADEVDGAKTLIKGGGGALVREKIVAAAARELVVIVDESKLVDRLGSTYRLPVEVMTFGIRQCARRLQELGLQPDLRVRDGKPFESDNGNRILDCGLPEVFDAGDLDCRINAIPGVVDNGLFVGMTSTVLVGRGDGSVRRID